MNFKNFDLRNQIGAIENAWYYKDYKKSTKINKHSVVFNKDFKFELEYKPQQIQEKTEDIVLSNDLYIDGFKEASKGDVIHFEKGEVISDEYIRLSIDGETIDYYGETDYLSDPNDILKDIMVYIANRI